MADELIQAITTDSETPQPQAGSEDFDAERAKALIAKLRGEEKRAKALEKELAQIRQADDERKLAEMTQVEQLQAKLQKADEARQRLEAEYANQMRRNAVITAAVKAGMHDPDDAVAILANVDVDGLGEALDGLKASKPYLFKSSVPSNLSPTNPSGGAGKSSDQDVLNEIYGIGRKSSIWGGPGGGVVWNTNMTE
jgi:hypothetical protein